MTRTGTTRFRKSRWAVLVVGLLLGGQVGCAELDEFSWRKMNFEVFREPKDSLDTIRNSKDGNARARALRSIREPAAHGGSQEQQDAVVAVLNYSASHETQPWCRIAAIDALRKFRDPRAAEGLKEAYYRAGSFPPETATTIRCQALSAMGEAGHADSVEVLVRVLREPPVEGPDQDRDLKSRERHAAARALGNFNQSQGISALVEVLRRNDDDALRNNAHRSLVSATGRDLPADPQAWDEWLKNPQAVPPSKPNLGDRILQLTGLQ